MNTSSNAAPTAASATSPISAGPIHFERPDDIPAERWEAMRDVVDKRLAALLHETYVELDRKHHAWCAFDHPLTEEPCSTRGMNLTNATYLDDGRVEERGKGWAGWLTADVDEDLVLVVLEGKPENAGADFGSVDMEIPLWQFTALEEIFDNPAGREALTGLLNLYRRAS